MNHFDMGNLVFWCWHKISWHWNNIGKWQMWKWNFITVYTLYLYLYDWLMRAGGWEFAASYELTLLMMVERERVDMAWILCGRAGERPANHLKVVGRIRSCVHTVGCFLDIVQNVLIHLMVFLYCWHWIS